MHFNREGTIFILDGDPLKLADNFQYLSSSISSTERDVSILLTKAWTATDRLYIISKSALSDKIKRDFIQAAAIIVLLYGCTARTRTKRREEKLDGNCTRMLWVRLNKSHPTKQQQYRHLPPITKTILVSWTRCMGHCWRSKDKLLSDFFLWNSTHGRASASWPARTYLQQLCTDKGCSLEDLMIAMDGESQGNLC